MSVVRGGSLILALFLTVLLLAPAAAASEEVPSAPRDVVARQVEGETLLLTWSPPEQGDVDGYRVYEDGVLVGDVTEEFFLVTSQSSSSYSVSAYNDDGEGTGAAPSPVDHVNSCVTLGPPSADPFECIEVLVGVVNWITGMLPENFP